MKKSCFLLFILLFIYACSTQKNTKIKSDTSLPVFPIDNNVFIPDFSYAGYQYGEKSIPQLSPTHYIKDFGAIPNDTIDDTPAIEKAITALHQISTPVVLRFDRGTYILKNKIFIERSNFVLQGAGSDENGTVISMPVPLEKMPIDESMKELQEYLVEGKKVVWNTGELFSLFSWTGGIIWTRVPAYRTRAYLTKYDTPLDSIATVVSGKRGELFIEVNSSQNITEGSILELNWINRGLHTTQILKHIYNTDTLINFGEALITPIVHPPLVSQPVEIVKIEGNKIHIKQPLMHDIKQDWGVSITKRTFLKEIGIENLRILCPDVAYKGHHSEAGYNPIYLTSVCHSWVKNVKITNADAPIMTDRSTNITIEDVEITGREQHYAIEISTSAYVLVKKTNVATDCFHTFSFNTLAISNVITQSTSSKRTMLDQHNGINHQNLFDNLTVTDSAHKSKIFSHGGASENRPAHGAFNTFWNININFLQKPNTKTDTVLLTKINDGYSARLVGLRGNLPLKLIYAPNSYEIFTNNEVKNIPSLYEYQLKKRLEKKTK